VCLSFVFASCFILVYVLVVFLFASCYVLVCILVCVLVFILFIVLVFFRFSVKKTKILFQILFRDNLAYGRTLGV